MPSPVRTARQILKTRSSIEMRNSFVVPYQGLPEFLRLLSNKNVTEVNEGLILLKNQLSSVGKSSDQIHYSRSVLYQYVNAYPDMDHFIKLWIAVEQNEECPILHLPLIDVTTKLLEALKGDNQSTSNLISFGIKLIDNHLPFLLSFLDGNNSDQIESVLLFLTAVCRFSVSLAKHLFHSFDFGSKTIAKLIGKRNYKNQTRNVNGEPKRLAIAFVMSFFYHSDSYLKLKMLDNSNLIYSCYSDLLAEDSAFVLKQIEILSDYIMLDGNISRNRKVSFFIGNKFFLQNIFDFYFHDCLKVVSCLDGFLRKICLSSGKLLHFSEDSNKTLLKILSYLKPF